RVAGNHAHFLYDFSPEVVVLRWTHDPAPRMLLCFEEGERGEISLERLHARVRGGDILADEIVIGCVIDGARGLKELEGLRVRVHRGVKAAFDQVVAEVKKEVR